MESAITAHALASPDILEDRAVMFALATAPAIVTDFVLRMMAVASVNNPSMETIAQRNAKTVAMVRVHAQKKELASAILDGPEAIAQSYPAAPITATAMENASKHVALAILDMEHTMLPRDCDLVERTLHQGSLRLAEISFASMIVLDMVNVTVKLEPASAMLDGVALPAQSRNVPPTATPTDFVMPVEVACVFLDSSENRALKTPVRTTAAVMENVSVAVVIARMVGSASIVR